MLTHRFEQLVIWATCFVFVTLIAIGVYCQRRCRSYNGTGRVAEIEAWQNYATLAWICAFCLSIALIIKFI